MKKVFLARDEVQLILNASRALSSGKLTITVAKGGDVTIELLDDSNDKFELSLETKAENLGESNKQFTTYFFTDVFSAVIKASAALYETFPIIISEASAKIRVGSYDITLLSPMDND